MTRDRRVPIVEVAIGAPREVVWHALRDPAGIRRWFGWEGETHGGLEAEIDRIFGPSAAISESRGTIGLDGIDHRFEVEAHGADATVVRVTKPGPAVDGTWDEIEQGWVSFVEQLRFSLERHRGRDRSTLMLAATAGSAPSSESLGLHDAEPVFARQFQTGVAVGTDRATLVILHAPPAGGGRVIVSAYGVRAEDDIAMVRDRFARAHGARTSADAR